MPRLTLAASLTALTLAFGAATAFAQESGGIALAPEVLAADNAQGKVLEHVLGRMQQIQQLRLATLSNGTPIGANQANTTAIPGGNDPQSVGATQVDALSQAAALRRRASSASLQQQIINNSQSLTVNAYDSPVSIGSNNIVKQQVTSSTAISANGPATATAGAVSSRDHGGSKRKQTDEPVALQNANSTALSQGGGAAHAVASNTDVAPQAGR